MAEQVLHRLADDELAAVLRGLAPVVAWPSSEPLASGADLASAVRNRIENGEAPAGLRRAIPGWGRWPGSWRPARRALVLALVALLAVAAMAGAFGLGLPGLRFILGEPPAGPSPGPAATPAPGRSPSASALGSSMGLGDVLDPTDAAGLDALAGFTVRWPVDPALGPPSAIYIDEAKGGQVTLLWPASAELPTTLEPGVGLLLSEFRGAIDQGFFAKVIGAETTLERVRVGGRQGYWLSGDPHIFFWDGPAGFVDDQRRWVGDVLLWSDGPVTYRLETSLGRDRAIAIAELLP